MQYTNEWIEQGRREGSERASRRGLKCLLERLQDALESGADLQQLEELVP